MEMQFEKNGFGKRLKGMLKVDARRMFLSPLYYIMIGLSFVMPILILVMTTMMDGTVSVNPQTGVETVMEGFDNVWQILGSTSDAGMTDMSLTSMCNINMLYFFIAAFVCLFVAEDFRSGYAKNLFTVRAKKSDYILSKSLLCFAAGGSMLLVFFLGAMVGGGVSGLSFAMTGFGVSNLVFCMLSKIFLASVYSALCLLASVIAKKRAWLSIILALAFGMLFFTMIPMISPLDSSFVNVILCLVGGVGFGVGIGAIGNAVLKKTSLV